MIFGMLLRVIANVEPRLDWIGANLLSHRTPFLTASDDQKGRG